MFKSCTYCGKIHKLGEVCPKAPKRAYRGKHHTEAVSIRSSAEWKHFRNRILTRDHYCCRYSFFKKKAIVTDALEVHHIIPLERAPERAFDESNVITLTREVHELAEAGVIKEQTLQDLLKKDYSDVILKGR